MSLKYSIFKKHKNLVWALHFAILKISTLTPYSQTSYLLCMQYSNGSLLMLCSITMYEITSKVIKPVGREQEET